MAGKTKYLEDYVPYMKELYPFLTEDAIYEMMEDSFDIIRKTMVNQREVSLSRRESSLFEDKKLSGNFLISNIALKKYKGRVINRINTLRDKYEKDNK